MATVLRVGRGRSRTWNGAGGGDTLHYVIGCNRVDDCRVGAVYYAIMLCVIRVLGAPNLREPPTGSACGALPLHLAVGK